MIRVTLTIATKVLLPPCLRIISIETNSITNISVKVPRSRIIGHNHKDVNGTCSQGGSTVVLKEFLCPVYDTQ